MRRANNESNYQIGHNSGLQSFVIASGSSTGDFDNPIMTVSGSHLGNRVTIEGDISASGDLVLGDLAGGAYISASQGNLELSGSGTGQIEVDYRLFDTGSSTLTSAGGGMGDIVKFGDGSGLTAGDIYMLDTDGTWEPVDADAGGTTTGSLAVALSSNATEGMLLRGLVKLDSDPSANIGAPVYVSTTAGHAQSSAPSTSTEFVRVVGYYMGNSGQIYFNPDNTWVKVS